MRPESLLDLTGLELHRPAGILQAHVINITLT